MLKKRSIGAVVASIALAASLVTAVPATAAVVSTKTAAKGIPGVTCDFRATGVTSSGQIIKRGYRTSGGKGTITTTMYNPGRLPFVPRGILPPGGAGGMEAVNESFYSNSTDGGFYSHTVIGRTGNNDVKVTSKRMAVTWGQTRLLVGSYSGPSTGGIYAYGLTDSGALGRYTFTGGTAPKNRVVVGNSGWKGVKTLQYDRPGKVAGTNRTADVLLATTADGMLVEYTIPHDKPSQWTRKNLKTSTWGNFVHLSSVTCGEYNKPNQPRMLLGVQASGDVYLYLDKRNDDNSGADIVGYGRIATGWKDKIFKY